MKKNTTWPTVVTVITVLILIGAGEFVLLLFRGTKQPAEVVITSDTVTVTGQYGADYPLSSIRSVRLLESIPAIGTKVNGAGLGDIKKGDYKVEGMGVCRLFLHTDTGPYLVLDLNDGHVILCFEDAQKTQALYHQLSTLIGGQPGEI